MRAIQGDSASSNGWARRLALLIGVLAVVVSLSLIAACGGDDDDEATGTSTGEASGAAAGTDIPEAEVKFAFYPCCADHAIFAVAIEKGFMKDVGITPVPPEGHQYTVFDQIVPSMQRGDQDVAGMFVQGYLNTLPTFGQDIPPILFHDIYVGYAILKAPDNDAKTALEFMDEGMEFPEAAKAAMEQLRGEEVYTPPHGTVQPPYPDVFLSYGDMNYPEDLELKFLEDPKIVELSTTPGRMKWAIPYAAPVLVQMIREGWEPVINVNMIFEHDNESDQAARMRTLVGSSGLIAQRDWVDNNEDTVLRLLSSIYRAIDYVEDPATQQDGWKIESDLINATQGLKLIPEDIGTIFEEVDPLFPWDQQGEQLWDDPDAPYHVRSSLDVQIQSLIDNKTIPDQEYDMDQFLVAERLYKRMKELQTEADGLIEEADSADLSGDKAELVETAKQHYEWHNYLDAVRFLKAALEGN
jgi:ABC-type nitrate/sulfonate/bicarbonate transport system substrate-binding protein